MGYFRAIFCPNCKFFGKPGGRAPDNRACLGTFPLIYYSIPRNFWQTNLYKKQIIGYNKNEELFMAIST
jgi:hypothetical protein